jgi:hypothetical protein
VSVTRRSAPLPQNHSSRVGYWSTWKHFCGAYSGSS